MIEITDAYLKERRSAHAEIWNELNTELHEAFQNGQKDKDTVYSLRQGLAAESRLLGLDVGRNDIDPFEIPTEESNDIPYEYHKDEAFDILAPLLKEAEERVKVKEEEEEEYTEVE